MCLLAIGCHADERGNTVVDLWALGREGEVVTQLLPGFEKRNPGVTVRTQQVPWSAAHEKILTAFAGESLPDVVQVGNTWIPELAALGAIDPLDERIAASPALDLADFFPGALDTNAIEGKLFGIPWYVDTRVLFYRKDLLAKAGFREPPQSWQSWVDAMKRIRQASPNDYAILLPMNEWRPPVIFALELGAHLLRDGDRYASFQSPLFRQAFTFYLDLYRLDLAPRAGHAQVTNLYSDFARGTFTFYLSGPWDIGEFKRRLPESLQDAWATAPLPAPDGRIPGASTAGGASLALVRTSDVKDAAWKLIEYLSEPEQQIEFHRLIGDLPSRKSAWVEEGLDRDPHAAAFWIQLQNVAPTPKIPEWERIASKISQYGEAAIRGSMTIDEALAALDEDVDQILEKRRWMLEREARAGSSR